MPRPLFLACLGALLQIACLAQTPPATTPVPTPASTTEAAAPAAAGHPAGPARITFSACHVEGPYIAMTFDDGPHAQNTPRLLDMLKERGIKATFFMVGQNASEYPQIVKRIVAEGHEVANHSWSHPQLNKMSDDQVRQQITQTTEAIIKGGGVAPKLMRPPYGAFTERQQHWCFGEFGLKVILWDVDPEDWKYRNAEHVKAEILKHTVAGSIILSHDIHKTTIDAMPATLDALAAKGFKFVTVSELIAMDKPKPKATPAPKAESGKPAASAKSGMGTATPSPKATVAATPDSTAKP